MVRARTVLTLCIAVPAAGWIVNTVWPAPRYGYLWEQAALVVVALLALALSRKSETRALLFYCVGALVPVGAMLAHWGDASPLVFTPHLGVIFVAVALRDERAVVVYGVVALLTGGVFGFLAGDDGLAGALAFLAWGLVMGALWWVRDYNLDRQLEQARADLENVQRGLRHITGELGNVPKRE